MLPFSNITGILQRWHHRGYHYRPVESLWIVGNTLNLFRNGAIAFIDWLGGVIQVKTPNRHPIWLEGLAQQHCLPGHENRSNARLHPNQPHVRWGLQPDAIAPSTHRGPPALQRKQCARPLQSRGKEHLDPVRHSCEGQRLAGLHRHIGKPQSPYYAPTLPIQAPRDKTAPQQLNPPRTRPSQRFCSVTS